MRRYLSYGTNTDRDGRWLRKLPPSGSGAPDMRACRKRQSAGIALFYVATDGTTYDMMQRYAGLSPNKVDDKSAVRAALGRLLRAGLNGFS
jgi:hypothetical protein